MDPITQAILAAMKSGKFNDLSSATMDPVMSYLMGTYKSAPKFDETQMWERHAPNTLLAMSGAPDDPHTVAAKAIRAGTAPWALYGEVPKNVKPAAWTKFIDSIANEQQTVKSKIMEQGLEQDPFQKMGLPGAEQKYTLQDMYKYAPDAFAGILKNVDANSANELKQNAAIDAQYGDVMAISNKDRLKLLANARLSENFSKEKNNPKYKKYDKKWINSNDPTNPSVYDEVISSLQWNNPKKAISNLLGLKSITGKIAGSLGAGNRPDPAVLQAISESQARDDLKKLGNKGVLDVAATNKNKSYANYLKSFGARTQGSASKQLSDAEKFGALIQSQLESQGQTPLKDALAMAVLMKNKMKNG